MNKREDYINLPMTEGIRFLTVPKHKPRQFHITVIKFGSFWLISELTNNPISEFFEYDFDSLGIKDSVWEPHLLSIKEKGGIVAIEPKWMNHDIREIRCDISCLIHILLSCDMNSNKGKYIKNQMIIRICQRLRNLYGSGCYKKKIDATIEKILEEKFVKEML